MEITETIFLQTVGAIPQKNTINLFFEYTSKQAWHFFYMYFPLHYPVFVAEKSFTEIKLCCCITILYYIYNFHILLVWFPTKINSETGMPLSPALCVPDVIKLYRQITFFYFFCGSISSKKNMLEHRWNRR